MTERSPVTACVGLGANLGDAPAALREAARRIASLPGVLSVRMSSLYRSAPVDAGGPDYTNAAALVETTLPPLELLHGLQQIERELGRVRPPGVHNAPRTIDLDLELYGGLQISLAPELVVPHPRMHERAFVLEPLLELDPEAVIPGRGPARNFLGAVSQQRIERLGSGGRGEGG
ncbi:2-amino-4-hydroxy-6-hydroxymethyldihydropteridine diphosphokinase [Mesosutterella sp. AGMB02718]|uniref:2-amino-4-hydroxy-6-hydroxymethyldihydropteridine pyrophosphokinase n=1 Tax=Mesosutterella faecium TaxID=2925194 RepID=A0ABT7IJN0_9BURK|nr:2-amino-4-hydroxy-6-hydroxymethyldihydropteridine diphosphokinase [Mesosutterella sp. AGMB02718]MDL2058580.1 2-amino-4-hydroxy-6-hydroxymethyldihydropteridine diphosphokinase [Mesosutterella sp. AGMB02718]